MMGGDGWSGCSMLNKRAIFGDLSEVLREIQLRQEGAQNVLPYSALFPPMDFDG